MALAGGWRTHLFVPGKKYRVLKSDEIHGSEFVVGSTVEFESAGYERYDNLSMFRFFNLPRTKKENINGIIWHLSDDEPDSKAAEYFAEV